MIWKDDVYLTVTILFIISSTLNHHKLQKLNKSSVSKILVFCFLFISVISIGQKYNTVMGMRFGEDIALSFEQRLLGNYTFQFEHQDGLFTDSKFSSFMLKKHHGILGRRFNVFMGGGAILKQKINNGDLNDGKIQKGLGLTFGGEFTLGKINITYDYVPGFVLGSAIDGPRFFSSSGIGIRYVMWGRKSKAGTFFAKAAFWKKKNNNKKKKK